MAYTNDLDAVAKKFGEGVTFQIEGQRYRVIIANVYFKPANFLKTNYSEPISGLGFTIEDACADYMRRQRDGYLWHKVSDKVERFA